MSHLLRIIPPRVLISLYVCAQCCQALIFFQCGMLLGMVIVFVGGPVVVVMIRIAMSCGRTRKDSRLQTCWMILALVWAWIDIGIAWLFPFRGLSITIAMEMSYAPLLSPNVGSNQFIYKLIPFLCISLGVFVCRLLSWKIIIDGIGMKDKWWYSMPFVAIVAAAVVCRDTAFVITESYLLQLFGSGLPAKYQAGMAWLYVGSAAFPWIFVPSILIAVHFLWRRIESVMCIHCGYPLMAPGTHCVECGTLDVFDRKRFVATLGGRLRPSSRR